ncbi:MAG: hypothetical protein EHM72_12190 [Calditrichaeota bacterium]|nr:MAG: hypothetical protein EHM72_12190 [Calditrichota bacterium]
MDSKTPEAQFKLKFDGPANEIEAVTFLKSLSGVTSIVEEVNDELQTGSRLRITIKSLEKGSFIVNIGIGTFDIGAIQTFLSKLSLDTVQKIITCFVSILNLRKLLKGEKPKEIKDSGSEYQLTTNRGTIINVDKITYNIYLNNDKVNDAVGIAFEALDSDHAVTGFEVLDGQQNKLFEAVREDFEGMSQTLVSEEVNKKTITAVAVLNIYKVIFDNKYKWEFYLKGNKISANICDADFFKRIDSGEHFAKGDSMEVELQIEQIFDSAANTYINKSYQINRVIKHIPRNCQENLLFD